MWSDKPTPLSSAHSKPRRRALEGEEEEEEGEEEEGEGEEEEGEGEEEEDGGWILNER